MIKSKLLKIPTIGRGFIIGGIMLAALAGCKKSDPVGPDPTVNLPPTISVVYESNLLDEVTFDISVSDDNQLARLVLNFGLGNEVIDLNSTSFDTTIVKFYGDEGADYTFTATIYDTGNLSAVATQVVKLTGWAEVVAEWKTYLNAVNVDGAEFRLSHESIDFDTVLVSDNGWVSGRIPKGLYDVMLVANPAIDKSSVLGDELSNISRINLGRDFTTSDYSPSFWHGRNDTYLVSGPGVRAKVLGSGGGIITWTLGVPRDVGFTLNLNKDLMTVVQTLENGFDVTGEGGNGYLLEEMSRQTNRGMLEVPNVDIPLYIVHNWGDHNCPDGWSRSDGRCSDLPPGIPIDRDGGTMSGEDIAEIAKTNFANYVDRRVGLLEDVVVGGNPYDVRIISGWAEDVKDYYPMDQGVNDLNNVEWFAHSRNNNEHVRRSRTSEPLVIEVSVAFIGRTNPNLYSNESTMAFSITESSPIVWKSIRDEEEEAFNAGYGFPDSFYYPKDEMFHKIAAGFGPYAQKQFLRGEGDHENTNGFNIQLYHYPD